MIQNEVQNERLIPAPRANLVTYHGVLAPAARWRSAIVPAPAASGEPCGHRPHDRWIGWRELLLRTFGVDPVRCPRCDTPMTIRAVVRGAWVAGKLLSVIGDPAEDLELFPARASPDEPWA